MKRHLGFAAALVVIVSLAAILQAQDGGNQGQDNERRQERRQNDGGGDRRGGGPAEWQARMAERMKEQLQVSDEEWGVLQPKLEKVMAAQRDARGGGMMGRGGFGGGPGGPGGEQEMTPTRKAGQELREALESETTSADDIAAKLAALREARKQAAANLETARKDLRELLTQRQEASLVLLGILE